MISPDQLRRYLAYDPETGVLFWRARTPDMMPSGCHVQTAAWNSRFADTPAGTGLKGYVRISICGQGYAAHRAAWALHYGEWPDGHIDHIDGDPANNRIANLRTATNSENQRNTKISRANSTGFTGVYFQKSKNKYRAEISAGGKRLYLGIFARLEDAVAARAEAERRHGYSKLHGLDADDRELLAGLLEELGHEVEHDRGVAS
ncbi:HNH endonuclease [Aliiruegeria lutimaris]|uniref:HNH endonuclease n=1 Tax=Aliiruegeria lutimaris TaxID=571298 RepID=A0A1G9ESW9_9RHOB|nr:HNH endonuclease [Aliiruegeria lutimaris]SDK79151.1 HNH endonuclease [Aliiruegeria lutimaris]